MVGLCCSLIASSVFLYWNLCLRRKQVNYFLWKPTVEYTYQQLLLAICISLKIATKVSKHCTHTAMAHMYIHNLHTGYSHTLTNSHQSSASHQQEHSNKPHSCHCARRDRQQYTQNAVPLCIKFVCYHVHTILSKMLTGIHFTVNKVWELDLCFDLK